MFPIWCTLYCWSNLGPFLITQACSQIEHGIMALFGPSDLLLGTHVQSLCDALDIPHLEARYSDPNLNSPFEKFCQFIELDEENIVQNSFFSGVILKTLFKNFPSTYIPPKTWWTKHTKIWWNTWIGPGQPFYTKMILVWWDFKIWFEHHIPKIWSCTLDKPHLRIIEWFWQKLRKKASETSLSILAQQTWITFSGKINSPWISVYMYPSK